MDQIITNKINRLIEFSKSVKLKKDGRLEGYTNSDIVYPRVTSVLQYDGSKAIALMDWAKRETVKMACRILTDNIGTNISEDLIREIEEASLNEADNQKDTAASEGTIFHNEAEKYLSSYGKILLFNSIDKRVQKFVDIWENKFKPDEEIVCYEQKILYTSEDKTMGYGGTLDFLTYNHKRNIFCLNDFKTSKSIHSSYAHQLAAYAKPLKEIADIEIGESRIFHFPNLDILSDWQLKDHNKLGNVIYLDNMKKAEEQFMLLLRLWYNRNEKYIKK